MFYPTASAAPVVECGYYAATGNSQASYDYVKDRAREQIDDISSKTVDEKRVPIVPNLISNISHDNHFTFEHINGLLKLNIGSENGGSMYKITFQRKESYFSAVSNKLCKCF